jgi:hypothetical protein
VAGEIIRQVGKGRIKHVPMRAGEPERTVVVGNPDTLRPLYDGERPVLVELAAGIAQTIPYYRDWQ